MMDMYRYLHMGNLNTARMTEYEPYLRLSKGRYRNAVLAAVGHNLYPHPVEHFLEQLKQEDGGDIIKKIRLVGLTGLWNLQATVRAPASHRYLSFLAR